MTTAGIALAAAAATLVLVVLAATVLLRARARSEARMTRALGELGSRMESIAHELGDAIAHVQTENRRQQVIGELGTSIDLDEVLARTAEAASLIPGVDASLVRAIAHDGSAVGAAAGLSDDSIEKHVISGPPDGRDVRAVSLSYLYPRGGANRSSIRSGLAVPLHDDDDQSLGFLSVYGTTTDELSERTLGDLELLAERVAPAIGNARRYGEARQLADTDALTGLHNRRTFHETLSREVARAQRYGRTLALIVLDLDDFKIVNDTHGHLAGDAVLTEVGERLRSVARTADIACRIGGEEFAVILPECGLEDAEAFYQRLANAITARPISDIGSVQFSAGIGELRPDDDSVSLFERADRSLYAAKGAGKNRAVADGA
jgi:diguanylate cyclase (GGDEF)-like protein